MAVADAEKHIYCTHFERGGESCVFENVLFVLLLLHRSTRWADPNTSISRFPIFRALDNLFFRTDRGRMDR